MKTKENHWDISKKNFYENLKKRKDALEEEIQAAKEARDFCEFDDFERDNTEYAFLKATLGTNHCFGTQWDYCELIHLPKLKWTDSEGIEHIHTLIGTHSPMYYGFMSAGQIISQNNSIEVSVIEPNNECGHEDDRKVNIQINTQGSKNKYLHTNATTGNVEWVDAVSDGNVGYDVTTKQLFVKESGAYTPITEIKTGTEPLAEKGYVDTQDQAILASAKGYTDTKVAEAGKVDDVKVNGTSVVTDKVANIDLTNKMDLLGSVPGHTDLPYNLSYFYYTTPAADKITVSAKTISLDNKKTQGEYSLDVPAATTTTAGLMSASDKIKLGNVQTKVIYSETTPTSSEDGDIWMF